MFHFRPGTLMMTTLLPDFTAFSSLTSFAACVAITPVRTLAIISHSFSSRMESPAE
ncbi:hypothetical protein HMPREF3212_02820 [Citrobacter freundii]|nr:hypothetical protein HMPREF3212_02820 [Citrobacter freundii]